MFELQRVSPRDIATWESIQDTDAIRVEQAGRAKSFLIQSIPWQVTDPTILATGQVFA